MTQPGWSLPRLLARHIIALVGFPGAFFRCYAVAPAHGLLPQTNA
jgi:hypothetical protein